MIFDKEHITSRILPQVRSLWLAADTAFPDFLPTVIPDRKAANESWLMQSIQLMQKQMKSFPGPCSGPLRFLRKRRIKRWMQKMLTLSDHLLLTEPVLGIRSCMSSDTLSAFQENTRCFLRQVRSFAPDMTPEDMGQALRNFMVYAIFREQNGLPPSCPSSIFGYSMLYPYTDNFLDDPQRSMEEKKHYNLFIRKKISGQPIPAVSVHEEKTALLLDAIADAYPAKVLRHTDDAGADIRQGLLLMLEAQEISQRQCASPELTGQDILDISIYKGGLSVLIDRCFIDLPLTEEDVFFYFGFGFLLQLCDDLQDIGQDKETGSRTLLSICDAFPDTEAAVNRIFSYTAALFKYCPGKNAAFRAFLLQNCYELILSSAIGSATWFDPSYPKKLESFLPVSLAFMEEQKSRIPAAFPVSNQAQVMEMLDVFLQ